MKRISKDVGRFILYIILPALFIVGVVAWLISNERCTVVKNDMSGVRVVLDPQDKTHSSYIKLHEKKWVISAKKNNTEVLFPFAGTSIIYNTSCR